MTLLRRAYDSGVHEACAKFALAPPTPADAFAAAIETAKEVPPPSLEEPPAPVSNPHAPFDLTPKLAVSGQVYARALENAAHRGGGRIGTPVLDRIKSQTRATLAPGLATQARTPGALTPNPHQQDLQKMMHGVPWAGEEHSHWGNYAPDHAQTALNAGLQQRGLAAVAPGTNDAIRASFGPAFPGNAPTGDATAVRSPNAKRRGATPLPGRMAG